jgi:hypothetical protein
MAAGCGQRGEQSQIVETDVASRGEESVPSVPTQNLPQLVAPA